MEQSVTAVEKPRVVSTVRVSGCPVSSREVRDGPHRRTSDLTRNTRNCSAARESCVKFSLRRIWNQMQTLSLS